MSRSLPPFQSLVDAYAVDVRRLAVALVGANDGDDVAQQAWLQALAAYPALRDATNLRGWVLTVTHRCAMDHFRRTARVCPHEDPAVLVPVAITAPPASPDPQLWAAVADLPERQRDAVVLRYVADLDHAEIAAALGTTATATRRLVSDGLATLRRSVGP